MAELEDALVLGTNEEIRGGSSPSIRIWVCSSVVEHRAFNLVAVGSSPITLNRVNHAIFMIKSLKILYEKINFEVIIQGSLNKENSPFKKWRLLSFLFRGVNFTYKIDSRPLFGRLRGYFEIKRQKTLRRN